MWPLPFREGIERALAPDGAYDAHMWVGACVHAFALSPSDSNVHVAERLLRAGASPNAKQPISELTALHLLAAGPGHSAHSAKCVADAELRLACLLGEHGAEWRSRDAESNMAMHHACLHGRLHLVRHLCEHGSEFHGHVYVNKRKQAVGDRRAVASRCCRAVSWRGCRCA